MEAKIIKIISDKIKNDEWDFKYECEEDKKGKIVVEFLFENKKYKAYFDYRIETIDTSEEIRDRGYVGVLYGGIDTIELSYLEIWEQRNDEDYGLEFEKIEASEIQTQIEYLEL